QEAVEVAGGRGRPLQAERLPGSRSGPRREEREHVAGRGDVQLDGGQEDDPRIERVGELDRPRGLEEGVPPLLGVEGAQAEGRRSAELDRPGEGGEELAGEDRPAREEALEEL